MPKLKSTHIFVTDEEDAIITAAALSDPDALPFTDAEWEAVKPLVRVGRPRKATKSLVRVGRPRKATPKVFTGIRLDADVLDAFKSTGRGWQTRMNDALKDWLKSQASDLNKTS